MEFVPRPEEEEIEESYKLLLNLSNHPLSTWSEKQLAAANEQFDELADLPFPEIDPEWGYDELMACVEDHMEQIVEIYNQTVEDQQMEVDLTVHIMGEMSFTHNMVRELQQEGIHSICSTSRRISEDLGDGRKISKFEFVRFRDYVDPRVAEFLSSQEGMGQLMEQMSSMMENFMQQSGVPFEEEEEEDGDFGDGPYFYDEEDGGEEDLTPPRK